MQDRLSGSHAGGMQNAFTIDVEDYFQVWALADRFPRERWTTQPCRVERNVDRLLALCESTGAKGTFFTLGWIAERYPEMVRRIVASGHELASHGSQHHRVTEQTPAAFLVDIRDARKLLEDIGGAPVIGYRAPNFSVGDSNPWAFDCIVEAGYRYSSSVYPVEHDHYGMPRAPRFAFQARDGLTEIPLTTVPLGGRNLPAGGGGYFRLLPYAASRWLIRRVNERDRQPAIFYLHPWEIDPDQPRPDGVRLKARFRHYVNLGRTEARLGALLRDFRWNRIDRIFLGSGR